jgi:putative membrane protein insertion efficiency factor
MSGDSPVESRPAGAVLLLLRGYQRVSRMGSPRCRFAPTCSQYAVEAVTAHGARHGTWLALRRIARCHPFNPGGVDHVPLPKTTGVDGVGQGARP